MDSPAPPGRHHPFVRSALHAGWLALMGLGISGCAPSLTESTARDERAQATAPQSPRASCVDATVLFIQTCHLLEGDAWEDAARSLDQLRELAPHAPEVRVLASLLEQRRHAPGQSWPDAFVRAWKQAGAPDLREGTLLTKAPAESLAPARWTAAWERAPDVEARLVLALNAPRELPDDTSRQWLVSRFVDLPGPYFLRAAAERFQRPEEKRVLHPLLQKHNAPPREEMQVSLLLLLDPTKPDAPISPAELSELERITRLPDYRTLSLARAHAAATRLLTRAGLEHPAHAAFMVVIGELLLEAPSRLSQRVRASEATLTPSDRARLGHVLWNLGERMAAEPTLVERMVGWGKMKEGAGLLDDAERMARADGARQQGLRVLRASQSLRVDDWPLVALQREWLDATVADEWTHLSRLVTP
ncbi:hypothetical protein LZ198_29970 [Myxococcus sp. K15C18031901]|uniref:hypothetical protein n=1 Tax=Myxococcus dinghuensis TaxID=2906761 RepID=UPI0020A6F4DC|nr:hypothetical protein [Myxococcus dinghuensis]MCP3103114.1 hypothetical protein [Myxococcus dinghuensis]